MYYSAYLMQLEAKSHIVVQKWIDEGGLEITRYDCKDSQLVLQIIAT